MGLHELVNCRPFELLLQIEAESADIDTIQ